MFNWLWHELLMIFINAHKWFAGEKEGMIWTYNKGQREA